MKAASLPISFFLLASVYAPSLRAQHGPCTGSEQSIASNLEQSAKSCSADPQKDPSTKSAAGNIGVDAGAIDGLLGNLCPEAEKGNEVLSQGNQRMQEANQRTAQSGELNRGTAEVATSAYSHAEVALGNFQRAKSSLDQAEQHMRSIESEEPAAAACPVSSAELRSALNNVRTKLEQDIALAEGLKSKAEELAQISNQVGGGSQDRSSNPSQASQPSSAPQSQTPSNSPNQDQDNQQPNYAQQPQGGNQGNNGNNDNNDKPSSQPLAPPPPSQQAQNQPSKDDKEDPYKKILAELKRKKEEEKKEAGEAETKPKTPYKPSSDGDLGFASNEARQQNSNSNGSRRALSVGLDTGEAAQMRQGTSGNPAAHSEDVSLAAPSNTSFLSQDLPQANRALASPGSEFQNLSVEEALRKINQIPIQK